LCHGRDETRVPILAPNVQLPQEASAGPQFSLLLLTI
jgi:hypothetical protein